MPEPQSPRGGPSLIWHLPAPSARQVFAFRAACGALTLLALVWWGSLIRDVLQGRAMLAAVPLSFTALGLWALEVRRQIRHLRQAPDLELHWWPAREDALAGWFTPQGSPAELRVLADVGHWVWLRCRVGGRSHWRVVQSRHLSTPLRWRLFRVAPEAVASSGLPDSESIPVQSVRSSSAPVPAPSAAPADAPSMRRRA